MDTGVSTTFPDPPKGASHRSLLDKHLPSSSTGLFLFFLGTDFLKIWIWVQSFLSVALIFFQEILINGGEFTCPLETPFMLTQRSHLVIASLRKGAFPSPAHRH